VVAAARKPPSPRRAKGADSAAPSSAVPPSFPPRPRAGGRTTVGTVGSGHSCLAVTGGTRPALHRRPAGAATAAPTVDAGSDRRLGGDLRRARCPGGLSPGGPPSLGTVPAYSSPSLPFARGRPPEPGDDPLNYLLLYPHGEGMSTHTFAGSLSTPRGGFARPLRGAREVLLTPAGTGRRDLISLQGESCHQFVTSLRYEQDTEFTSAYTSTVERSSKTGAGHRPHANPNRHHAARKGR